MTLHMRRSERKVYVTRQKGRRIVSTQLHDSILHLEEWRTHNWQRSRSLPIHKLLPTHLRSLSTSAKHIKKEHHGTRISSNGFKVENSIGCV